MSEDYLKGATPEQTRRFLDVVMGKVPLCPECCGRLTHLADVDVSYCTDPSCLWNQDEATRRINERYG
jgi:hypothetical protein